MLSLLLVCSSISSNHSYHQFLCISTDFKELCDSVHKALVMEIAHLLNLTVMVPYPGIQLFHETLVGIRLVIINRPERDKQVRKRELKEQKKTEVRQERENGKTELSEELE